MEDEEIRLSSSELGFVVRTKPPPSHRADVWCCLIEKPAKSTRPPYIPIYFYNRARDAILQHARGSPEIEVGGALVGGLYQCSDPVWGRLDFIEITNALRGESTIGSAGSLTFTPDTWAALLSEVEARFPDQRIVGWYHTHPGHGAFLSGPDKFIQNHFFDEGGQLALVIDHRNRLGRFFIGSDKDEARILQSDEFTWDDDDTQVPLARRGDTSTKGTSPLRTMREGQPATERSAPVAEAQRAASHLERKGCLIPIGTRKRGREKLAPESEPAASGEGEPQIRIERTDIDWEEPHSPLERPRRRGERVAAHTSREQNMGVVPSWLSSLGTALLVTVGLLIVVLIPLLAGQAWSVLPSEIQLPRVGGAVNPSHVVLVVLGTAVVSALAILGAIRYLSRPTSR
ncbi:MAG TPA: Mov34/MPN/PAD-1 family protein [Anaerolineae bacterium]|nr:Mov34/MPN/PAD-1 family protein [Anaerolineae bacterium]